MTGAKILVVDDDRTTAKIMEMQLIKMGYAAVSIAKTGMDAVRKAKIYHPDLLLMDINLGKGQDGITVVEEILEERPIPVIYVTAYADDDILTRAKRTYPLGYINKPIREIDLRTTITLALERIHNKHLFVKSQYHEDRKLWKIQITCDSTGKISRLTNRTKKRLKELNYKTINDLLPKNHKKHIMTCLSNKKSQLITGRLKELMFSWEYFPTMTDDSVRITITNIIEKKLSIENAFPQPVFLEILDYLATGVILINENLNIFYTNKSAEKLLLAKNGLQRIENCLNCHDPETTSELQRMVLAGANHTITVDRGIENKPLYILATPLQAHRENYGHNLPIAVLFSFESIDNMERVEEIVRVLYNLSPAEAKIAARLVLTPNLAQAAQSLGITSNTARTHLKRIYIKTNTNRLSSLVHMIVTGPVGMILHIEDARNN